MTNQQLFDYLITINPYYFNPTRLVQLSEDELFFIKESIQSSIKSTINLHSIINPNQLTPFIYVTQRRDYERLKELLAITGDTEDLPIEFNDEDLARFALFPNVSSILIPKKAKRNISRYVPKHLLKAIDPDINKAIEKCLVFLTYLAATYYTENKWKPLSSIRLHEQLKGKSNSYVYTDIIKALKHGTATGPIIEVLTDEVGKETYQEGKVSKQFRLTDSYLKAGLEEYLLKDEAIIQQRNKTFYKALFDAKNNIICNNLIGVYQLIELPTLDEIKAHGRMLAKNGFITKKRKKLTMRNKHDNSYWKDVKERSFVEDHIELYQYLTSWGFMIPRVGNENSGGRVVDSFNLMPSWIRAMVKINGEPIKECDFSAMHPNLAVKLYGGAGNHISHQEVADYLEIPKTLMKKNLTKEELDKEKKNLAKKEHLSFFNKPFFPSNKKEHKRKGSMVQSPVFRFYEENEPKMLNAIKADKFQNGYKASTSKLFSMEVQLMTEVIRQLNEMGIFVLYVYDALYCAESHEKIVLRVMNEVAAMNGINTKAA